MWPLAALTGFSYRKMRVNFVRKKMTLRRGSTVVKLNMIVGIIKGVDREKNTHKIDQLLRRED